MNSLFGRIALVFFLSTLLPFGNSYAGSLVDIGPFVKKYEDGSCETTIATIGFSASDVLSVRINGTDLSDFTQNSGAGSIIHVPSAHEDDLYSFSVNFCVHGTHKIEFILHNQINISKEVNFDELENGSTDGRQARGLKSKALSLTVKYLAKLLRSDSVGWVLSKAEDYGSKAVVSQIKKHRFKIADKLDDLAKWEDLALNAIQDQVAGMLMGVGVKASTARTAGFVVKNLISWIGF